MIKPLHDRIVVKPYEQTQQTKGGLILGTDPKEKPTFAEVVAVGPGTDEEEMILHPGEKIVFSKYVGTEVAMGGETYILIRQRDVLGYVED